MQPYVIKQGDYLALLAFQYGFDADTAWNDPKNAALQAQRPNPNILFPGDVLYIPDPVNASPSQLATGSSNSFVTNPPTATMTLRFPDPSLASQAYSIAELPALVGLTTGGDGTATFAVPVTQTTVTLTFATSGATYSVSVGALDPIGTLSGVFERLQHLGYVGTDEVLDPTNLDGLKAAVADFLASPANGGPGATGPVPWAGAIPSAPSSAPSSSSGVDPAPPSSRAAPASTSTGASAVPPPSSSSPDATSAPASNGAGLQDDGTLDPATAALLVAAHGS
jgi:hypothetical protein